MKFSVVIPTYNEEKYIARLLNSLNSSLNKKHISEIIVSDCRSEDKTREIAKKYEVKIVDCPKRSTGMARNLGAQKTKSDYLVFIDADEIASSDLLHVLSETVSDGKGVYLIRMEPDSESFIDYFMFSIYNKVNPFFVKNNPRLAIYPGGFLCIQKCLFEELGGFNTNFKMSEDRDIVLRSLKYGNPKLIEDSAVKISTRRIKKMGWLKFFTLHTYSHIYFTIFNKPLSHKHY